MNVVFVGAVESSQVALTELLKKKVNVKAVITLKKELRYRHSDYVDLLTLSGNFPVPPLFQVDDINNDESIKILKELEPDYLFVVGWSQILGKKALNIARQGCIGFHPTLLPRNRGRAALPWYILNEETMGGISLFYINEETDAGDIIIQKKFEIKSDLYVRDIYEEVKRCLREAVGELADLINEGILIEGEKQNHFKATYLGKRTKDDGVLDFNKTARELHKLIRAVSKPYPGAFSYYKGEEMIFWKAQYLDEYKIKGSVGQVLANDNRGLVIQAGSGVLLVEVLQYKGQSYTVTEPIPVKIGDKLGINFLEELNSLKKRIRDLENKLGGRR